MEGRQPKRRKDKYNPYEIYEKDGKYYVSFRNGEKEYKDLEIGKNVYEAFNTFELQDVSHMNVVERHLEQSEICSFQMVAKSVKAAIRNLKKILR